MMSKGLRTALIWIGLAVLMWLQVGGDTLITYGEPYTVTKGMYTYIYQDPQGFGAYFAVWTLAVLIILAGCYIWTRLKNRHPAFLLWGLLAPVGLLGISLLKDKTEPVNKVEEATL